MKTRLLIVGTLLFTVQFFGQGFSGFRVDKDTTDLAKISGNGQSPNFVIFPNANNSLNLLKFLYGSQNNFLGQAGVTLGSNSGAVYTELGGGSFLKLFRLSLGVMVSNTNADTTEEEQVTEAYQKLVSYGGNTVLNIEYPWLFYKNDNYNFNLLSRFFLKGTADLPAMGSTTDDWAGSGSVGMNFYIDAETIPLSSADKDAIKIFFDSNTSYIIGTDVYQKNLGINDSKFLFGQLTAGLVYKSLKISFVFATFSSEPSLRNNKTVAGIQGVR
ncbi:hypothetical protein [Flavobacterium sp. AG291]|uniref:hypothetical protein n=1 Tax=Flavobacterium sp. AG291 TaxID=2184000 RepID=UPI000E0BD350|nr:hypothetical protein [Flavobacterium sp. AG291]RDI06928.1 hypothetical protein DEU42_11326 [Flavobacterium sp. AG291]